MKALILNFNHFSNKDKSKSFYTFDLYDTDSHQVLKIFTDVRYCAIPDGVVPSAEEIKNDFPRVADVTLTIDSYNDKNTNELKYRPNCRSINSWKKMEIK